MADNVAFIDLAHLMTGALIGLTLTRRSGRQVVFTAVFVGLFYLGIIALGIKTGHFVWSSYPDLGKPAYRLLQVGIGYALTRLLPELGVVMVLLGLCVFATLLLHSF